MPERPVIDGVAYELVVRQRGGSAVYRSEKGYLRLGPAAIIGRHLAIHRDMERLDYPVPTLLAEGEWEGHHYFLEETLPGRRLNDAFAKDTETDGTIGETHFEACLAVALRLLEAQCDAPTAAARPFKEGIHLDELCEELPEHAEKIRTRFAEAETRLHSLPLVLSHGDFNPANIFPSGMIDLEDAFSAPVGYDMATAIVTTDWFPPSRACEFPRRYHYSDEQMQRWYARSDEVLAKRSLPPLAPYLKDLEFCRAVWMSVGMRAWPKTRTYRLERLVSEFLA